MHFYKINDQDFKKLLNTFFHAFLANCPKAEGRLSKVVAKKVAAGESASATAESGSDAVSTDFHLFDCR